MARTKRPGDPWNMFSKKGKDGGLAKRKPQPQVKPTKALKPAAERPALPPAKPRLPAGKPGGALSTRGATSATAAAARSRAAGPIAGAIGEAAGQLLSPLANQAGRALGTALRPLGRAIDDRLPGVNSKDEQRRRDAARPLPRTTPEQAARYPRLRQATPEDAAPRPKPSRPPASSSSSSSRSSSSPSRPPAPSRPSPKPPTPAATSPKKDLTISRDYIDQKSGTGTAGPNMGIPQYTDKNGIDTERRRAFLDAKDSLSGMKAVRKLMEERKKKASGK